MGINLEKSLKQVRQNRAARFAGNQPFYLRFGVFVFLVARDVIGALTNAWMLYFGLLFIAIVLFRPEGIAGAMSSALQWRSLHSIRRQGSLAMRLLFGGERWR